MPGSRSLFRHLTRLLAGCVLLAATALESGAVSREYDIKAAFLYNFATFVEWPPQTFASEGGPIVIGVLGVDPFGSSLDEMVSGPRPNARALEVRRFNRLDEMSHCHILYVSSSEARRLKEILRQLHGLPVLTVGDLPGFAEAGGAIGFVTSTRVALVINPETIRASNLAVSAKLYKVARVVGSENHSP
ncbi:MAG TPA: YfiR family protein [Candidatus Didemnitutus sp.]|nr:YfiR family protein [Candidatus Didemnitutus sp.]